MIFEELMIKLKNLGTEQNRKIYTRHGCDIDMFGVSISNLKKVAKTIKNGSELGVDLFHSKNLDAIYLSQWIVDFTSLTIDDYIELIELSDYYIILDNVIPNILIKDQVLSKFVISNWLKHNNHRYRQVAYAVYSLMLASYEIIDINQVREIIEYISKNIHNEQNRVKYSMNSFVISAGIYLPELTEYCLDVSSKIGKVDVFMGKTSCKVPNASEYINKVIKMNRIGKKRKL